MTVEPLLPAARPSRYELWSERLAVDPVRRRRVALAAPLLVTLLAAVLRFWNLGDPHTLVFDETYYVKDAWSQWNLGFPATWPDGADAAFASGDTDRYTRTGSYAVHPPLGKWLIGAGMALFGPDSSFGWRFTTALLGTASVLVLYLLARVLTASVVFATIASGLMAIDGLAISMSRVGLLDAVLAFFVLLAFLFTALDRRRHLERLVDGLLRRGEDEGPPRFGPVLWNRPWIVAAGAAAGAAAAVKWSGVWVLAAIGLYAVVTDAVARRRLGVVFWPTDAAFRQGVASFLLLVPVAGAVYLASWTGWLVTDAGYARDSADAAPASGIWSWVPPALQSLWSYHQQIYASMAGMTSPHGYASPAWQWPLLVRPTAMHVAHTADGDPGCLSPNGCLAVITAMPNPLTWWGAVAAVLFLAYWFARDRDWRFGFVLTGVAATYVPWLLYPERTIFHFYTVVLIPFLLLAATFALQRMRGPRHAEPSRRAAGRGTVAALLAVIVLLSAFWYPLAAGIQVPYDFWRLHNWLPTWI